MLRGRKKRVVGRRLQRVVVGDVVDLRIGARVMALVCLARLGGVVPAHVTRQRRRSRRVVWDVAGIGAAVISELGASRVDASVSLTMGCVRAMGGLVPAHVIRERRQARRIVWDLAGIGAAVISELGTSRFDSVNSTTAWVSSIGLSG